MDDKNAVMDELRESTGKGAPRSLRPAWSKLSRARHENHLYGETTAEFLDRQARLKAERLKMNTQER